MSDSITYPKRLETGDRIGLVCPSSSTSYARVLKGKQRLEEMGYEVKIGKSCQETKFGYLAGDAVLRAEDINSMFADPDIDAVFCVRGGYGSSELMELLDYELIRSHPKLFVGYSDITNLHAAFLTQCNLATVHGPMVSSNLLEHYDDYTKESFETVLAMNPVIHHQNPTDEPMITLCHGKAKGQLVGGNLALLINMVGTFYAPDLTGKILFIEDIYESVPRVHRMLDQLRLLHVFDKVAGILIGDFSDCSNHEDPSFGIKELLQYCFAKVKVPVLANVKCGHCYPTASLLLGSSCEIDADHQTIVMRTE